MPALSDILFLRRAPDDAALFKNGSKVGEAIASLPESVEDNPYRDRKNSATAAINAALRSGVGRMPDDLRRLVKEAIRHRLRQFPEVIDETLDLLDRSSTPPIWGRRDSVGSRQVYVEYLTSAESAKEIHMFRPPLSRRKSAVSEDMYEMTLRKLGLASPEPSDPTAKYVFFVDSPERARAGWIRLFREITGLGELTGVDLDPSDAASRLEDLSRQKCLRFRSISRSYCPLPLVAHDIYNDETGRLYLSFVNIQGSLDIQRVPSEYKAYWKEAFLDHVLQWDGSDAYWDSSGSELLVRDAQEERKRRVH